MARDEIPCPTCNTLSGVRLVPSIRNYLYHFANGVLFAALVRSHGPLVLTLRVLFRCALCGRVFSAKEARTQATRCGGCGYNLTGNLSGTCPECGLAIPDRIKKLIASLAPCSKRPLRGATPQSLHITPRPTKRDRNTNEPGSM